MRSPPILSDTQAEEQAAQARDESSRVIEEHLANHMAHNPGRSSDYITWVATLHPENAEVTIDKRFLIPGNPWWTIYEGAKIPSATAVAVDEEFATVEGCERRPGPSPVPPPTPPYICMCSPIDMIVGIFVTLHAVLGVLICEIVAFAMYLVAVLFYWMAKPFPPTNPVTGLVHCFFMLFYCSFAVADSACLLSSILVTEILAGTEWLVSLLLAGAWMANSWHQYIRRTCHLIRWYFRARFSEPPRSFASLCMTPPVEQEEEAEVAIDAEVCLPPIETVKE